MMKYIGLLTHNQKQAGYFITQDDDFVFLWWGRNGHPDIIAIFLYETATIKEIRDKADSDLTNLNVKEPLYDLLS